MKKTKKELQAYKIMRAELEEQMWLLDILEQGCLIGASETIWTENYTLMQQIVRKYREGENDYWKEQQEWSVDKVFRERYKRQKKLLDEEIYYISR